MQSISSTGTSAVKKDQGSTTAKKASGTNKTSLK